MEVLAPNGSVVKYPASIRDLRVEFPQKSIPDTPRAKLALGLHPVLPTEKPEHDPRTKSVIESDPVLSDGDWVQVWAVRDKTADELTADQDQISAAIKAEAERRILAICPEWKQRNLIAQAAILAKKGEANWTQQEADAWSSGEAIWTQIAAIRAASDTLENDADSLTDVAGWEGWP